ncbi:CoA transferase subunit A [Paramicrobacterium chengjingii]|uniref:CoA transferase subunit A n=1 Tax=Paramicrobacterium chengjingii TaxID=2769067 RepID=A0ABX6YHN3_9MICO|nr:CoA transferase subunit A [Microbacterium chengjingii]QPZ38283.1 CoA transferase subunit A [Microbacterium chengjingii]
MKRKLQSLSDAASRVSDGDVVALGGSLLRRQPLALCRELVRRNVRDLSLLTWASSLATDLLAGAGCVRAWEGIYVGMWWQGGAPNFRRAVEQGRIRVTDQSESFMTARFRAAAMGLPFLPVVPIRGTEMSERDDIRSVSCPYTGTELQTVAAAHADITLLHAYAGDEYGNIVWPVHRDSDDIDLIMGAASTQLIVSVERVIPHAEVARRPNLTYIPHTKVAAVCEAPYGAYPGSCDTFYDEDETELQAWVDASRSDETFVTYLKETVGDTQDHETFLRQIGAKRLASLKVGSND